MMKERLLQRVDELIAMGDAVLRTHQYSETLGDWVDNGKMKEFRVASLSFIRNLYEDDKHPHYREFFKTADGDSPGAVEGGLGILRAIRGEIAGDWLFTVKGLVTAEVFSDYMEMAEYLMQEGYEHAAAVIAGSTLEEHLRQLCRNNGMPVADEKDVPRKADRLNSELAKAGVYNSNQQKAITGWLGIRNSAAHGDHKEYNAEQVKGMIAGIMEFMSRVTV